MTDLNIVAVGVSLAAMFVALIALEGPSWWRQTVTDFRAWRRCSKCGGAGLVQTDLGLQLCPRGCWSAWQTDRRHPQGWHQWPGDIPEHDVLSTVGTPPAKQGPHHVRLIRGIDGASQWEED